MDQSKPPKITPEMIDQAAMMAGIGPFSDEQKKMMIDGLVDQNGSYKAIRKLKLPNSVAPAYVFQPQLPSAPKRLVQEMKHAVPEMEGPNLNATAPSRMEDLAFATIGELARLLHARKITSLALTQMYIDRLKGYDPKLHFVITLTEERAIAQAKAAGFAVVGYYFDSTVSESIARNNMRVGAARIPAVGIYATAKKLQAPSFSEGFDALYYVRIEGEGRFVVEERVEREADPSGA